MTNRGEQPGPKTQMITDTFGGRLTLLLCERQDYTARRARSVAFAAMALRQ